MLTAVDALGTDPGHHVVTFYDDDTQLVAAVAAYLGQGLAQGLPAVAIATDEHRALLHDQLVANGIDVDACRSANQLVLLDARETLDSLLVHGDPDPERFAETVGAVMRGLGRDDAHVMAFGEMVALLWAEGRVQAALELERLWSELARERAFSLFCAYPSALVGDEGARHVICDHHTGFLDGPSPAAAVAGVVSRRFECTPAAARAARLLVSTTLHAWGLSDVVDDAELVVTELATNAIRHGGGRFTLSLSRGPDAVRLVVADPSRQLPESRTVNNELGTGGRGLHIVSTLSRSWGVEIDEGRKAVWAEIPVASSRVV